MKKPLGILIKTSRLNSKMSVIDFAKKLKVSKGYIVKIEMHGHMPNKNILLEICRLLQLDNKKIIEMAIRAKVDEYEQKIRKRYLDDFK